MRTLYLLYTLIIILTLSPQTTKAQDSVRSKKKAVIENKKSNNTILDLKKSLVKNDDVEIAKNYEKLGQEFKDKGNNAKAEEYFAKALTIYKKLNLEKEKPRVTRKLAKAQESQNKYDDAIQSYESAEAVSQVKNEEALNANDANRLRNATNPKAQADLVQYNISLLEKDKSSATDKEEVSAAYLQQAALNMQQNNKVQAIKSYNKAIGYAKDQPNEIIKIKNEIAKVYASDNQFDKAIAINEKLLKEAKTEKDFVTQITQLQSLSTVYFKKQEADKAVDLLKQAYDLAVKNGKTTEAKNTLIQLLNYYKSKGKDKESIALYDDFLNNFDTLIRTDTTLIDSKTFQVTEEKIKQLEKEKSLKDELITRKNKFNYVLIGSLGLLLLFVGFIAKALYSIKRKNKEIALQSLRREMNPHFIFNSLNSVNQFISENKELEANKYLTNYSNLMRNMMENSNRDFVTLSSEIEQLKKYLDLEHLRFQDKFNYEISIDENLDTETTFIPNMIIQPHLENAIWHGLRYMDKKGFLLLKFQVNKEKVAIIIDDNGIGLTKSQELKTINQKVHVSRGMNNTNERIALLNDLYKKEITFHIKEKKIPETGTIVEINFPLIDRI